MADSSDIDNALIALLGSDATLLALCPDNVYWEVAPPHAERFVLVSLLTARDDTTFDNLAPIEQPVYAVKAVMMSGAGGKIQDAAERIHELLHNQTLTVAGYGDMNIHRDEDNPRIRYTEVDEKNTAVVWQHRGGNYRVEYGEAALQALQKHAATHEPGGSDPITNLDAGVLTQGTLADARLSSNVVLTGDPRLTDARPPTMHHATHEPGGTDALVALSASILTSGTVLDARLSANVPLKDAALNAFTGSLAIGTNPASQGSIRLAKDGAIWVRNAANTGDVRFLGNDGSQFYLGGAVNTSCSGSWNFVTGLSIGSNPASAGAIRLANGAVVNARNAANTADVPIYVGGTLVNKTKAGTPTDADVTTPTDGMVIVDTTANKIWVRIGGAWKGVAVA